jgi:hypothetical protein
MKQVLSQKAMIAIILALAVAGSGIAADKNQIRLNKIGSRGDYVHISPNQISTYIVNNGSFNRNPGTGNAGFNWPAGSPNTTIFASGLWLGGRYNDTTRVAIAEYSYEYDAGPVGGDPTDSRFKVYSIRRGDKADPSSANYNADYANWPFQDGAPALRNFDNSADSTGSDGRKIPQIFGDMTVWCVYNDANPSVHTNMTTPPLGIEVQQTAFAFNRSDALGNTIFYKWKLVNKSGHRIDSMYTAIWSDCDIGGGNYDFDGCDTLLGLGYTYSGAVANSQYGTQPPAAGFDFLQGPIVPALGETARLPDGRILPNKKVLTMTSYLKYDNDASDLGNPAVGTEAYNYFKGLTRTGQRILDPNGRAVRYMFPGDPAVAYNAGTNWIEQSNPGDRRFLMTAGPFTMQMNDTQEVVGGNLIAAGANNIAAVTALKNADGLVQKAYDLNFKLPPPPPDPVVEASPLNNKIILTWGKNEIRCAQDEGYAVLDPIAQAGRKPDTVYYFQGYVIYQFANAAGADPRVVATYDLVDAPPIGVIYDDVFDPVLGFYVNKPVKFGSDNGIKRTITITRDIYTGQPLINDKNYYFAVTAYAYCPSSIPKTLESSLTPLTIRPRQVVIGTSFSSSGFDTLGTFNAAIRRTVIDHVSGTTAGHGEAIIVQPDSITGDTYEVRFDAAGSNTTWRIVNTTKNIVVDNLRTNQGDDDNFPIKDGIKWKVVDSQPGIPDDGITVTPADTALQWIAGDNDDWGMPHFGGGLDLGNHISSYLGYTNNILPTNYNPYKKVKLILGGSVSQKAYRYRRIAVGGVTRYRLQDLQTLPLQAWDVSDSIHPRQLNLAWRDQVVDSVWNPGSSYLEVLIICASTYDATGAAYGDGGPWESDAMYILGAFIKPNHTFFERQNIIWISPNQAHNPSDVYRVNTANYKATPNKVDVAKTQINRINVVPNPYFGTNAYERDQFTKVIRITNLPAQATIRIYSLLGELIRTLQKNDLRTTNMDWDLTNEDRLPVASGIYIIHVDMGEIGAKILKLAVIQSAERLDNY